MKKCKYIVGLLLVGFMFAIVPNMVNAEVVMTDYNEVIAEEIETYGNESDYKEYIDKLESANLEGYEEKDNKVNVYIFRGKTCGYCLKAISYFAEKSEDYKDLINLKTYEVWSNTDNSELMNKVASALGKEVSGVPFIVIGEKSFDGFSESMDSEIASAIQEEYAKDKKYDVMDHLGETKTTSTSKYNNKKIFAILGVIVVGIVGVIVAINYANKKQAAIEEQKRKALEEKKAMEKKIAEGKKVSATKKTATKKATPKKKTTSTKKTTNTTKKKTTTKKATK